MRERLTTPDSIVVSASEGFVPPYGFVRRVRAALNWIDPTDLEGIGLVFLFDEVPATSPGDDPGLDEALREGLLLFAAYKPKSERWPPHIMLIVQNLCKPIPRVLRRSPALTVWIAQNIMHEVGHHVIAERKFRLQPQRADRKAETEEEFADRFAASSIESLKIRTFRFGKFLLGVAAEIDYCLGSYHRGRRRYRLAADYFYLACQLNPRHKEAGIGYWEAKANESVDISNENGISI